MPSLLQCYNWKFQTPWKPPEHGEGHDNNVPPDKMHATQTHLSNNPIYYRDNNSLIKMNDLAVGMLVGTRKDDDECKQFFEKNCLEHVSNKEECAKAFEKEPKHMIGQCLVPLNEGETNLSVEKCLHSNTFVETHEVNKHTASSKTLGHIGKAKAK